MDLLDSDLKQLVKLTSKTSLWGLLELETDRDVQLEVPKPTLRVTKNYKTRYPTRD